MVISRKHWSPGSDASVQSVERRDSGGWVVSGNLAPSGICPDCGLQSRRRHGWRHRRLQDYPAHGDGVTVTLWVCRWRCLAPACPRRTFSDQIGSIARPFARRTSRVGEIVSHLGHATGGRPSVAWACPLRHLASARCRAAAGADAAQTGSGAGSRAEGHRGSHPVAEEYGAGTRRPPLPRPRSGPSSTVPSVRSSYPRPMPASATSPPSSD